MLRDSVCSIIHKVNFTCRFTKFTKSTRGRDGDTTQLLPLRNRWMAKKIKVGLLSCFLESTGGMKLIGIGALVSSNWLSSHFQTAFLRVGCKVMENDLILQLSISRRRITLASTMKISICL
jgi:hypothetical protein